jgi:hypothetical protein
MLLDAMFRSDNADVDTVEQREVNLRQAFQSGGAWASHISGSAAADSSSQSDRRTTTAAANRV